MVKELNDPYSELLLAQGVGGLQPQHRRPLRRHGHAAGQSVARDHHRRYESSRTHRPKKAASARAIASYRSTTPPRRPWSSPKSPTCCAVRRARRSTVVYSRPGVAAADQAALYAPHRPRAGGRVHADVRRTSATSRCRRSTRTPLTKCRPRSIRSSSRVRPVSCSTCATTAAASSSRRSQTSSLFLRDGPGDRERSLTQSADGDAPLERGVISRSPFRSSCSSTAVRRRRPRSSPVRCRITIARSSSAPRRSARGSCSRVYQLRAATSSR